MVADHDIIAQVKDMASVVDIVDVKHPRDIVYIFPITWTYRCRLHLERTCIDPSYSYQKGNDH
jgi:hypothetical protein